MMGRRCTGARVVWLDAMDTDERGSAGVSIMERETFVRGAEAPCARKTLLARERSLRLRLRPRLS